MHITPRQSNKQTQGFAAYFSQWNPQMLTVLFGATATMLRSSVVRQRQWAGIRWYQTRTCKRAPAALQRRRLMAQGKRASSLSNYTWVCAGVNREVCRGVTGVSKALMRILWTPSARLSEYFSRCQHFESLVTRVQTKMLPDFGQLPTASTALPQRPHGCTYSWLYFSANMIEKTVGRSTLRCNVILLDYLSCSSSALTCSTDFPSIQRSVLLCYTFWPQALRSYENVNYSSIK